MGKGNRTFRARLPPAANFLKKVGQKLFQKALRAILVLRTVSLITEKINYRGSNVGDTNDSLS